MTIYDYAVPVHRSLQSRHLMAGIPFVAVMILYVLTIVTTYMMQLTFFWIVIGILYVAARILTKKDPYLIDIVIHSLRDCDEYNP